MTTPSPSLDPDLERALRAIGACLAAVEAHAPKAPAAPPPRGWWIAEIPKWGSVITPLIVAVLGAFLAYYFTGYFQQTLDLRRFELELQKLELEQRRVDLGGIGQMRELIGELYRADLTPGQAEAISLSLAAFGDLAGPPLIQAIETGHTVRMTGAEVGLAAAALAEPGKVCAMLSRIIDNRTALFNWQTQQSAVRLLGRLGCIDEQLSIEAFDHMLGEGVEAYQASVRHDQASHEVDDAKLERLKASVRDALGRLEVARALQHDRVAGSGAGAPPAPPGERAAD